MATISARLGHRDKATTLNIYSHALPATDALAAETISRLIGDPVASTVRSVSRPPHLDDHAIPQNPSRKHTLAGCPQGEPALTDPLTKRAGVGLDGFFESPREVLPSEKAY